MRIPYSHYVGAQRALAVAVLCMTCSGAVVAEDVAEVAKSYKLTTNKQGIKVWTFQTPNSPILSYKATRELNATVSTVAAVITDANNLVKWVPYTRQVRVLDRDNEKGSFTLYMIIGFPFPLASRDVVVQGGWQQQPDKSVKIWSSAVNDARVPVNPKYVRIQTYEGSWHIKPLSNNRVEVTNIGYANPAGHIPLGLANNFVQLQPYQTLKNIVGQVSLPQYQQATVPLVTNP